MRYSKAADAAVWTGAALVASGGRQSSTQTTAAQSFHSSCLVERPVLKIVFDLVRETETSQASLLSLFAEVRRICMAIRLSSSVCSSKCRRGKKRERMVRDRSK